MKRREYLLLLGTAMTAGCSGIPGTSGHNSLNDVVTFGHVEVAATDAMISSSITLSRDNQRDTLDAPSGGVFALFKISAHNTDITEQDAPGINLLNYSKLHEEPNEIVTAGVNDIRVYGSGEGGHLPEAFNIEQFGYNTISVNGHPLKTYPATGYPSRPSLEPDQKLVGWMFGTIPNDSEPQLRVRYNEQSAMWSAGSTPLATPTPSSNRTIQM